MRKWLTLTGGLALLSIMTPTSAFADEGTVSPTSGALGTTVTVTVTACEGSALDAVIVGGKDGWYKHVMFYGQTMTVPGSADITLSGPPDQQGYAKKWMPKPGDTLRFFAACHKVPDPGLFPPGTPVPVGPSQVGEIEGATFTVLPTSLGANQAVEGTLKKLPPRQRIGKVTYKSTTRGLCRVKGRTLQPLAPGTCILKATNAKGKAIRVRIEVLAS